MGVTNRCVDGRCGTSGDGDALAIDGRGADDVGGANKIGAEGAEHMNLLHGGAGLVGVWLLACHGGSG